jgi:hypothetical protein
MGRVEMQQPDHKGLVDGLDRAPAEIEHRHAGHEQVAELPLERHRVAGQHALLPCSPVRGWPPLGDQRTRV